MTRLLLIFACLLMGLTVFSQSEYVKLSKKNGDILEIFRINDPVSFRTSDRMWIKGYLEQIHEAQFVISGQAVPFSEIDRINTRHFVKSQKTSGIILLSAGTVALIAGMLVASDDVLDSFFDVDNTDSSSQSGALAVGGTIMMVSGTAALLVKGRKVRRTYQWMRVTFIENDIAIK